MVSGTLKGFDGTNVWTATKSEKQGAVWSHDVNHLAVLRRLGSSNVNIHGKCQSNIHRGPKDGTEKQPSSSICLHWNFFETEPILFWRIYSTWCSCCVYFCVYSSYNVCCLLVQHINEKRFSNHFHLAENTIKKTSPSTTVSRPCLCAIQSTWVSVFLSLLPSSPASCPASDLCKPADCGEWSLTPGISSACQLPPLGHAESVGSTS